MNLTTRTVILDLLSTLRTGAMPVRALVEAGNLIGFAENNIRVSLSKLYAEGRVARDERGRYRLSPDTKSLSRQLRQWRKLEEGHRGEQAERGEDRQIGSSTRRHRREGISRIGASLPLQFAADPGRRPPSFARPA